jgi:hypothetical protein
MITIAKMADDDGGPVRSPRRQHLPLRHQSSGAVLDLRAWLYSGEGTPTMNRSSRESPKEREVAKLLVELRILSDLKDLLMTT